MFNCVQERSRWGWLCAFMIITALLTGVFTGCSEDDKPTGPTTKNVTFKVTNNTGVRIQFDMVDNGGMGTLAADREIGNGGTGTYQVEYTNEIQIIYSAMEDHGYGGHFSGRKWHLYLGKPNNGQTINLTATEGGEYP